MVEASLSFDVNRAIVLLLRFLGVEGVTGEEAAIGQEVIQALKEGGISSKDIHFDKVHQRIPLPTQTGNLIVNLPGTRAGPRRLFVTHLDTVPLCAGARPIRKGNHLVAGGQTALGGDNRTGVACLVSLGLTLKEKRLPHPPITLLFTVREESGLWGARFVEPEHLHLPKEAFNVDGWSPAEITVGAVGANRWEAEIQGRAAHAGVHPERGISATMVASLALADAFQGGWFGKVKKADQEGTSNVGSFGGQEGRSAGVATNVVTDYALIRGEARSHNLRFIQAITAAYRNAFRSAAGQVRDDQGRGPRVRFTARRDYYPFRLGINSPVVRQAQTAAIRCNLQPTLRVSNGGLDANWIVRHRIPTVTIGAGQNNIHAIGEYVDLQEFEAGCRMALALATG